MSALIAAIEALPEDCHTDDGYYHQSNGYPCSAVDRDAVLNLLADSLDAAWAEAEAALPEGWFVAHVGRHATRTSEAGEVVCYAEAEPAAGLSGAYGYGPTAAAALRDLAARLRA